MVCQLVMYDRWDGVDPKYALQSVGRSKVENGLCGCAAPRDVKTSDGGRGEYVGGGL